jgi:hypothetical protein
MNKILSFLKIIDYSWKESLSDMTMKNLLAMKYAMFVKNTLRFFIAFFVIFSVVPNTYFVGKTLSSFTVPMVLSYEDQQSGETKVGLVDVVLDYSQSEKFKQEQERKTKLAEKPDVTVIAFFTAVLVHQVFDLIIPERDVYVAHPDIQYIVMHQAQLPGNYLRGPPQLTRV